MLIARDVSGNFRLVELQRNGYGMVCYVFSVFFSQVISLAVKKARQFEETMDRVKLFRLVTLTNDEHRISP